MEETIIGKRILEHLANFSSQNVNYSSLMSVIFDEIEDLWTAENENISEVASRRRKIEVVSKIIVDIVFTQWKNADHGAYDAVRTAVDAELYEEIARRYKLSKANLVKKKATIDKVVREKLLSEPPRCSQSEKTLESNAGDATDDDVLRAGPGQPSNLVGMLKSILGDDERSILRAEPVRPSVGLPGMTDLSAIPNAENRFNTGPNISMVMDGAPIVIDPGDLLAESEVTNKTVPEPSFLPIVQEVAEISDVPLPGAIPSMIPLVLPNVTGPDGVIESHDGLAELPNIRSVVGANPVDEISMAVGENEPPPKTPEAVQIEIVAPIAAPENAPPPKTPEAVQIEIVAPNAAPENEQSPPVLEVAPVEEMPTVPNLPDSGSTGCPAADEPSVTPRKNKKKRIPFIDKNIKIDNYAGRAVGLNKKPPPASVIYPLVEKYKQACSITRLFSTPACSSFLNPTRGKRLEEMFSRQLIVSAVDKSERMVLAGAKSGAPAPLALNVDETVNPEDAEEQRRVPVEMEVPPTPKVIDAAPIEIPNDMRFAIPELSDILIPLPNEMRTEILPEIDVQFPIAAETRDEITAAIDVSIAPPNVVFEASVVDVIEEAAAVSDVQISVLEESEIHLPVVVENVVSPIPPADKDKNPRPSDEIPALDVPETPIGARFASVHRTPEKRALITTREKRPPLSKDFKTFAEELTNLLEMEVSVSFYDLLGDNWDNADKIALARNLLRLNGMGIVRLKGINNQAVITKFNEREAQLIRNAVNL